MREFATVSRGNFLSQLKQRPWERRCCSSAGDRQRIPSWVHDVGVRVEGERMKVVVMAVEMGMGLGLVAVGKKCGAGPVVLEFCFE